ncbi:hypothetical protein E1286_27270 [Nonomuraea terrae]|uniref:Uncharacterized protein n=1 Tax=Nonomuraea terrae TaxID=2530383 RepID=A0A4R4YLT4_9ACTN|nr:hypothetical protein E1286_27270 [Nonomuraea terrae]
MPQVLGQLGRRPALAPQHGGRLAVQRRTDRRREAVVDRLPDEVVPERQPVTVPDQRAGPYGRLDVREQGAGRHAEQPRGLVHGERPPQHRARLQQPPRLGGQVAQPPSDGRAESGGQLGPLDLGNAAGHGDPALRSQPVPHLLQQERVAAAGPRELQHPRARLGPEQPRAERGRLSGIERRQRHAPGALGDESVHRGLRGERPPPQQPHRGRPGELRDEVP